MPKRLEESFQPGDQVEISLADGGWTAGRVVSHEPPGVWVQSENGRYWFVTNTRRIRRKQSNNDA